MPIGNYTLDEIYIGDEVTFLCASVNTDHAWIVHGKEEYSIRYTSEPILSLLYKIIGHWM